MGEFASRGDSSRPCSPVRVKKSFTRGPGLVTTQLPVITPAAKADEITDHGAFVGVMWGWIFACLIVGLITFAGGANFSVTAFAAVAALAPAAVSLVMRRELAQRGPAHVTV